MMRSFAPRIICLPMLALSCINPVIGQQTAPSGERSESLKVGNISGIVVNENGQPIANASVVVRPFGSASPRRPMRTNKEGKFQVTGLDEAVYLVRALAPGYTSRARDPNTDRPSVYRIGDFVRLELIRGGVITGTVTTESGEPVVGVRVQAHLVRDANNRPPGSATPLRERSTDDRGIYRLYGLQPGTYIVSAGGGSNLSYSGYFATQYDTDAPTFAPSSTRDTASEIIVRGGGEETNNVDIRYRGEQGHVVSGTVTGAGTGSPAEYSITLSLLFNGQSHPSNYSYQTPGNQGFSFHGVADGDYYLTAQLFAIAGEGAVSEHRRITVRGADVTGIELATKPLGSVSGQVILQDSGPINCKDKRRPVFAETLVSAWHNEKKQPIDQPRFQWGFGAPASPDNQGIFDLKNLAPGQYRFQLQIFAKYWYWQSVSLPSATLGGSNANEVGLRVEAARKWTTVRSGQRVVGLKITLALGAASFQGQLIFSERKQASSSFLLYLLPVELERADDVLRFFVSPVAKDGTFALNHLPPGRYSVLLKEAADGETSALSTLRSPDEANLRARLRQEAATSQNEIELKPCQNMTGFQLTAKAEHNVPK